MDTSETYIKMCEKAVEIQRNRPPLTEHDYIIVRGRGFPLFENIWLPQQDQLQDIHRWKFTDQAIRFWEWASEFNPETEKLLSWEQLWLGFVMKERYSKIWNGEEWIKS